MALVRTALLTSCTVDRRYSTGFLYKRRRTRAGCGYEEFWRMILHAVTGEGELCSSAGEI
eukprot:COSAG02_NODE_422_length_22587_cov_10.209089_28_plen_60_part_00